MTFADATWLLIGAGIGVAVAFAIPLGLHALTRALRHLTIYAVRTTTQRARLK